MKFLKIFIYTILLFTIATPIFANEESTARYKARITSVDQVDCEGQYSQLEEYSCAKYTFEILEREQKGETFQTGMTLYSHEEELFANNSKVYVSQSVDLDGRENWNVESYSRESQYIVLISIFILLTFWINGKQGFGAALGLMITIIAIYGFTIPMIIDGASMFWIGLATITIILFSSYLSHGFNKKTSIALISMFIGALLVFVAGYFALKAFHLTGIGEENSNMLYQQLNGNINLFSILLFSIVLGAVGVLDDVTIGQVSSMQEILRSDPKLTSLELYKKSMNIGRDHIASMINTLFIAYAGSSLSLVLVLAVNNPDLRILLNLDFIGEEIVRTVVASIGLIVAVPLSTFLASNILKYSSENSSD